MCLLSRPQFHNLTSDILNLLLFEVLEFNPGLPRDKLLEGGGAYRVAWGFLRPAAPPVAPLAGASSAANAGDGSSGGSSRVSMVTSRNEVPRRLRLQLYAYPPAVGTAERSWVRRHELLPNERGNVPPIFLTYQVQLLACRTTWFSS